MSDAEDLAVLVDALVNDPFLPRPDAVSESAWAEAQSLAELEKLLGAPGAPALEADPVAAMLGLVPVSSVVLDGVALKRLRGKLSVSDVANRLRDYGWEVSAADVRSWQDRPAALAPALVERLAAVLGATVPAITRQAGSIVDPVIAASPRWQTIVDRFADLLRIGRDQAELRLAGAIAAAAYRHEAPDSFLEAADGYVTRLEEQSREA